MSGLEERLQAVLSDPAELARLSDMARQLMGGAGKEAPPTGDAAPPKEAAPPERAPGPMKKRSGPPLLQAVGPYLDEDRRRRLERALRLASAARTAGAALEQLGGLDGL